MNHHDLSIRGQPHVELDAVRALVERALERGHRVFGQAVPRAAMTEHVRARSRGASKAAAERRAHASPRELVGDASRDAFARDRARRS